MFLRKCQYVKRSNKVCYPRRVFKESIEDSNGPDAQNTNIYRYVVGDAHEAS